MSKNGNGKHKPETVQEAVEAAQVSGPIAVKDADCARVRAAWREFENANLRLASLRRQYLVAESQLLAQIADADKNVTAEVEVLRRANGVPDGPGWHFDPSRTTFVRAGAPG